MLGRMTAAVGCPEENALVRFSTGQLSGPDLGHIEGHLDTCSACRSLVALLASGATEPRAAEPIAVPHGLVGRYQIERLLGGGGMGMVYAARDRELNRVVAIKRLRTTGTNAESRARLLREAQTMAKLSHPNLVPIFELGSEQGDDFLAMELIDGPTLDEWLRERKREWRELVQIFIEAGRGLEAAHQAGVVHRDFKPGNVLIGPDGRARVTDFGLSRPIAPIADDRVDAAPVELTREGSLLGTPAYMSPEQLEGQVADVRSDQFNFCVALTEALVGHRPFPGRTLEDLRAGMRLGKPPQFTVQPARLEKALRKGMSISPDARFPSMGALLDELSASARGSVSKRPFIAAAVLVAAVGAFAWQQRAPEPFVVGTHTAEEAPAPTSPGTGAKRISLFVGAQKVLTLSQLQRVAVGDSAILDVKTIGNNQVLLIGVGAGTTSLRVWKSDGTRLEWEVGVASAYVDLSQHAFETGEPIALKIGGEHLLSIPGMQRVNVGDSAIADVKPGGDGKLVVKGVSVGTTTLRIWTGGTADVKVTELNWVVTVEK